MELSAMNLGQYPLPVAADLQSVAIELGDLKSHQNIPFFRKLIVLLRNQYKIIRYGNNDHTVRQA